MNEALKPYQRQRGKKEMESKNIRGGFGATSLRFRGNKRSVRHHATRLDCTRIVLFKPSRRPVRYSSRRRSGGKVLMLYQNHPDVPPPIWTDGRENPEGTHEPPGTGSSVGKGPTRTTTGRTTTGGLTTVPGIASKRAGRQRQARGRGNLPHRVETHYRIT